MSCLTPPGASNKVRGRLRQYRRREQIVLWIGAALAGIIATYAAIEFTRESKVPVELLPVTPVSVVAGGFFLALARIQFEWKAELLDRGIEDGQFNPDDPLPKEYIPYPECGELMYYLEMLATAAAGIAVAILAIWASI